MKQLKAQYTDTLTPLPDSMTVCATIDESGKEQEITELMIRRACEQMDADQLWPYASDALCVSVHSVPAGGARIIPFRTRSRR
ncbi:MAG: hypothetical protein HKN42_00660 [Granulosicoccus sp.]|nr:hypothetical protein [Granulosicoccus sp.]